MSEMFADSIFAIDKILCEDLDRVLGYAAKDPTFGTRLDELTGLPLAEFTQIVDLLHQFAKQGIRPTHRCINAKAQGTHIEHLAVSAQFARATLGAAKNKDEAIVLLGVVKEKIKAHEDRLSKYPGSMTGVVNEGDGKVDAFGAFVEEIPLERFPKRIAIIASYLAIETSSKVTLKHLMAASCIIGGAIGRNAEFRNWGSDYYLNLAVTILLPSGGNKSGLYQTIKRLCKSRLPLSTPSVSTIEGFLDTYCVTIAPDKKRTNVQTNHLVRDALALQAVERDGQILLLDEARAMFCSLLPKEQSVRNGQLLCRLLERDDITSATSTGGVRCLGDTCFTLLGFSQTDPWNDEMRNAAFQNGGLAGRICPVNEQQFNLAAIEPLQVNERDAVQAIEEVQRLFIAQQSAGDDPFGAGVPVVVLPPQKAQVSFGEDGDPLGESKAWFNEQSFVKGIAEHAQYEVELLQSKMLIQAAKLAGIMSIAYSDTSTGTFDGKRFLRLAYFMVGCSHLGNLGHLSQLTEQGKVLDKVKGLLARKGAMTKRDLMKYANLKGYELDGYIKALVESGDIMQRPGKRKGIVYFCLR